MTRRQLKKLSDIEVDVVTRKPKRDKKAAEIVDPEVFRQVIYKTFMEARRRTNAVKLIPDEVKCFMISEIMHGETMESVSQRFNISPADLKSVVNDPSFKSPMYMDLMARAEGVLKSRISYIATRVMSSISDKDIQQASLLQKTTAISQMIDKLRLLDNKSTSNVAMVYDIVHTETNEAKLQKQQIAGELERLKNEISVEAEVD